MSKAGAWITIELTPERIERAKRKAARQLKKYPEDRGDFQTYGGIPREMRIEHARMAEEAIAQHLDVERLPSDVKSQWAPHTPANAHLKIAPDESAAAPDKRWVLVTGREPNFRLLGGARAREASSLGKLRDDVQRPAYYIVPTRLHAISQQRGRL